MTRSDICSVLQFWKTFKEHKFSFKTFWKVCGFYKKNAFLLKQTPLDNKGLTFLELKWTICQSPLISSFIFFSENLQIATTTFRIVILASVNTRDLPSKQVFLQWHWWLFQETKDRSFFSNLCFRQRVEMLLTFYVKT